MADREGRPEKTTVIATGAAIVATALTVPMWFDPWLWEGSFPCRSETYFTATQQQCGVSGLSNALWVLTFVIGVTSMALAIVARRRERTRGSAAGQKLARWAKRVAILGACSWGLWTVGVAGIAI